MDRSIGSEYQIISDESLSTRVHVKSSTYIIPIRVKHDIKLISYYLLTIVIACVVISVYVLVVKIPK